MPDNRSPAPKAPMPKADEGSIYSKLRQLEGVFKAAYSELGGGERAIRDECAVVSCSALRRAYRDLLRGAGPGVWIVHLAGPYDVVAQRLAGRHGHFMPPELLASQYATLEPLAPDEPGITLDLTDTPTRIVDEVLRALPRSANSMR